MIQEDAATPSARGEREGVGVIRSLETRMRGRKESEPGSLSTGCCSFSGKKEGTSPTKKGNRVGGNFQGTIFQVT